MSVYEEFIWEEFAEMALQNTLRFYDRFSPIKECKLKEITSFIGTGFRSQVKRSTLEVSTSCYSSSSRVLRIPLQGGCVRGTGVRASRSVQTRKFGSGKKKPAEDSSETDEDEDDFSASKGEQNDPYLMDPEERREWRKNIREVMHKYPDVNEEFDPEEKRTKMQKLLADYPLVVEEDDPDWPEDADGWGFNLGQFFNKITIKNAKKDDDENNDSENEIVWQDDDYIRPIKDITSTEWEETVFKDISPLIVLVHNRYKRPKENQRIRDELEKAVHIIWNCRLPSPRCVAVDAVIETDLVSALKVSVFPEIIFTKAGKILYREQAIRNADEFSKIMAYFYYGATKPPCLNHIGDSQELIPSLPTSSC